MKLIFQVQTPTSKCLGLEDKFTAEAAKKYLLANGNLSIVPVCTCLLAIVQFL